MKQIPVCDQCVRLQEEYRAAAEVLLHAQRELACFEVGKDGDSFERLWSDCQGTLKQMWRLRDEMVTHTTSHGTPSTEG
jgi:hypothetical protein